jgi:hypothetical protein
MDRFFCERREFRDPRTGRTVWQVTDGDFECSATYMDKPCWSRDEKRMLIASNRTGAWQPYRLDLERGEAVQIYETSTPGFIFVLVPETGEAFVPDGQTLAAVDIDSLEARVAVDFTKTGHGDFHLQAVVSSDGAETSARRGSGRETEFWFASTDGKNRFERLQPDSMPCQPGHDQFVPAHPRYISINAMKFDREDPLWYDWFSEDSDRRVKTWRIDRSSGEVLPLIPLPKGMSATHVVWSRDGERLHFHRKTQPGWLPTALCSVNRDGEDFRVHYETNEHRLGHSCPHPSAPWTVSDSQDKDENILLLAHHDRDEAHMLCWPNTSIHSGRPDTRRDDLPAHPHRHTHPGFSPTGKYVHYTSDCGGTCQVYLTAVDDLTGE